MYDVVVVGAGSAGCALAARLSEDPGRRVLLLEAGPVAAPPEHLDGARPGHPLNWAYPAELRPGVPARIPRGRVLGGSSVINGANWVRATPADADGWGVPGWTWADLLPHYVRSEHDLDLPGPPWHGDRGPVRVRRPTGALRHPVTERFVIAAQRLGHPAEPDKNAGGPPGVGLLPANVVDGLRVSAAAAYLAVERPNLTVRVESPVARVLFDGARARGVTLLDGTAVEAGEVVLAAGAVATPQLLQLSGIGPPDVLRAAGVAVLRDLPVGTGWSDHPAVFLPFHTADPSPHPHAPSGQAALDWDAGADPAGDVSVLAFVRPFTPGGALHLMCVLAHPDSRGTIALAGPDPRVPPRIAYRYLHTEHDRRRLRHAVRTAADLLRAGVGTRAAPDGAVLGNDRTLDEWLGAHLTTAQHLSGSAPIGPVLDARLRVHGLTGLRVADTSALPTVPRRGTAATATAIGEKAADLIHSGP